MPDEAATPGPAGTPRSIGGLLPAGVAVAEAWGDEDPEELYPLEAAAVARAVESRRREFGLGRTCARRALARAGLPIGQIPVDGERAPIWPPGVIGSITHCRGYVAAAVAARGRWSSIGVDAEPDEPLPGRVRARALLPEERAWVDAQGDAALDRLVFSAKESVYKAWYPLARGWLDFRDAQVTVDLDARTFHVAVRRPGGPASLSGRYDRVAGLVRTAVVV